MKDSVSIIITVFNGERWIDGCFNSILRQNVITASKKNSSTADSAKNVSSSDTQTSLPSASDLLKIEEVEVCIFDDASTDKTTETLEKWSNEFRNYGIGMKIINNLSGKQKGVGYGRNQAVKNSSGNYLCFQDIDDEMLPDRISEQYKIAKCNKNAIVGSKFIRLPENSTCRFSRWANELTSEQLETQIYTSNGPTVIMPSWFCHRKVFESVGGFDEGGHGTPEDLIFFYRHLHLGGHVLRAEKVLLIYRYHPEATTFSISEVTIWKIRLKRFVQNILESLPWRNGFTIWNAGKQGRHFFRDIPDHLKDVVKSFCDIDTKKINKTYEHFSKVERKVTHSIPIIHFSNATPPIVVCVKLFLTNGVFEENLKSLNLTEGRDYVIFS